MERDERELDDEGGERNLLAPIELLIATNMATAVGVFSPEGSVVLVNPALAALLNGPPTIGFDELRARLEGADRAPVDLDRNLGPGGRWEGWLGSEGPDQSQDTRPRAVVTVLRDDRAGMVGYMVECYSDGDGSNSSQSADPGVDQLTAREHEVLRQLAAGGSNKSIGRQLNVSARTIEFHRANIMRKFGLRSLPEVLRAFYRR